MNKPISKNEFNTIISKAQHVLAYYWAEWCSDCKRFAPHFEKLVEEYEGKIKILKLDIDQHREVSDHYVVMSIPTLMLFKNGIPVARMVEERSINTIKKVLDKELSKDGGLKSGTR